MEIVIYGAITLVTHFMAACIAYRMGYNKGIDRTLEYLHEEGIPEEYFEKRVYGSHHT